MSKTSKPHKVIRISLISLIAIIAIIVMGYLGYRETITSHIIIYNNNDAPLENIQIVIGSKSHHTLIWQGEIKAGQKVHLKNWKGEGGLHVIGTLKGQPIQSDYYGYITSLGSFQTVELAKNGDFHYPAIPKSDRDGWNPVSLSHFSPKSLNYDFRQTKWHNYLAVSADLNGDHFQDKVELAKNGEREAVVAYISQGKYKFKQHIIREGKLDTLNPIGVDYVASGIHGTYCGENPPACDKDALHSVTLKNPGFMLFHFGTASSLQYFEDGKFKGVPMSD